MPKKVKVRDARGLMKSKAIIHPNSRKAKQITRAVHRIDKLDKRKVQNVKGMSSLAEKLVWFQQNLVEGKTAYTYGEILQLIMRYIERNDEAIQMAEEIRKNGGSSNIKSEVLFELKEREMGLYYSGFQAPDLTRVKIVKALKGWEGDLNLMSNIELKTFVCKVKKTCLTPAAATSEGPGESSMSF
eukprot:Nk52_evm27s1020 gene=Nk52_evmTU27s1020